MKHKKQLRKHGDGRSSVDASSSPLLPASPQPVSDEEHHSTVPPNLSSSHQSPEHRLHLRSPPLPHQQQLVYDTSSSHHLLPGYTTLRVERQLTSEGWRTRYIYAPLYHYGTISNVFHLISYLLLVQITIAIPPKDSY